MNPRPFAGRVDEPEWVMLREVVPSATAPLRLVDQAHGERVVVLATVLPMAWPALVRSDGVVYVGLQTPGRSGDVGRDVAQAILRGLDTPPGSAVTMPAVAGEVPPLTELLDPAPLDVTIHGDFDFWVAGLPDPDGEVRRAMERANNGIVPTERLTSVEAAYWCRMRERSHLRWAMPDDEESLLDALARLAALRALGLGDGTRYVGSFRADGLLVPVWDLPLDMPAAAVEEPAVALRARLDEELASPRPLTDEEKRARAGLLSRQLTLR